MKDILNLALLQLAPCDTPEENLRRGAAACRKARALGADLSLIHICTSAAAGNWPSAADG